MIAKRRAKFTAVFWQQLSIRCKMRDGGECRKCGRTYLLEAAHIIGLGMGASRDNPDDDRNVISNLVTLCHTCHTEKDSRHEWLWESIGVEPDQALAERHGWMEAGGHWLSESGAE